MAHTEGRADLHLHSAASDGMLRPAEVAQRAAAAGLFAAALTDHDTQGGVAEFQTAARALGVVALAGAEIASVIEGDEVHLLCYFLRPPGGAVEELLESLTRGRRQRGEAMVERAIRAGHPIDPEQVLANPQIGRPHLARELVRVGAATSVADAFKRHLYAGGPIHVERLRPNAADVIALVRGAGGIVSLGHPCRYRVDHLEDLIALGLPAIEVSHPSAGPGDRQRLRAIARRHGLLMTGGSDFHGHHDGERLGLASASRRDAEHLMRRLADME